MPKGRFGKDLSGQKPFKILWIEKSEKRSSNNRALWRCVCDCGTELFLPGHFLSHQKSCGCIHREERKLQEESGLKYCYKCKQRIPVENFSKNSARWDGLHDCCIPCNREKSRQWRIDNPEAAKSSDLKKRYGITLDQKQQILLDQGSKCAICSVLEPGGQYNEWCLDHDHNTKIVRAVICQACNLTLGNANESIDRLISCAKYLLKHTSVEL